MTTRKIAFLSLFTFIAIKASAYEAKEGNVNVEMGPFFSKTKFSGPGSETNKFLNGFGMVVVGDLNDKGALDFGLFYQKKAFYRESDGEFIGERSDILHFTMGYRRWFNWWLSGSLSFSSAYTMGEPLIIYSTIPAAQTVETSARDITDYGFDFALQSIIYEFRDFHIMADVRYSYSVTNKDHERSDHYGVMLAVRYFIQSKEENVKAPPKPGKYQPPPPGKL